MTDTATRHALAYYSRIRAALFPIPAGKKEPFGLIENFSFKRDCSTDPKQWEAWSTAHPGCNWGVVGFASQLLIVDIDTKEGRDAAWALWCELCASWEIPVAMPHVQSARGGWHVYFRIPADIDPKSLRQPDAIKKLINIRCIGYTVAAGSTYNDNGTARPYVLMSDADPYPAPAALIRHCTRAERNTASPNIGTRDRGDVAALLNWLNERDAFADYESWCQIGMALKTEYSDAGFDLWESTFDDTVTPDVAATKWNSFSDEPTAGSVTLSSFLDRAHRMGWRGTVRKSAAALFDGVAQLAASSGATLSNAAPGLPMLAGQEALADHGRPILLEFLAATSDAPARPASSDFPTLPASLSGHGLYNILSDCIARIFALADVKPWKPNRVSSPLAILSLVHVDVFDAVSRRLNALGLTVSTRQVKLEATRVEDRVQREFVSQDQWIYDPKGQIEHNNVDNVAVYFGILGVELRFNAWLERIEIRGGTPGDECYWSDWSYVDDTVHAQLSVRAGRTKTRFLPSDTFLWKALLSIARENCFDPVLQAVEQIAAEWDGVPRLSIWLTMTCGVECDTYHQAVSRLIVGSMIQRIREPGCKRDEVAILFGPQGTGKSTLARILAISPEWFSDEILLGDASKELVLSLAGKTVIEISEMGMRGSANPNHVKAMLSRQTDRGRTAYARSISERPRRNIFIGTTNESEPLVDPTGNRRFLPVRCDTELNLAWLAENIRQIVGEAATLHSRGVSFDIPRSVWSIAAEHQEAARSASDVETMLNDWFAPGPHTGDVNYILASDFVWLCQIAGWRHGGANSSRGAIMKRIGFTTELIWHSGKRVRVWVRKPEGVRPVDITRLGVRYLVGAGSDGRPQVTIRRDSVPAIGVGRV